jgi:hypothetical protein
MSFAPGKNTFEVVPNFSLRALRELNIEFIAKPRQDRVDPNSVTSKSGATDVAPP